MIIMHDNPIVIFWSGGFDSTLLLLDTLRQLNENNDDAVVQCVTVISDRVVERKNERECKARNRIKDYIKTRFPDNIVQYREIIVKTDDDASFNEGLVYFGQPLLWSLTVIPFLEDNSRLLFGYILDDHLSTCKFYSPFNSLLYSANELCCKQLTFDFPLITVSKKEIINALLLNYPEIFDYMTCCENAGGIDNCGRCQPCDKLKNALLSLSLDVHNNLSDLAKLKLKDKFGLEVYVKNIHKSEESEGTIAVE